MTIAPLRFPDLYSGIRPLLFALPPERAHHLALLLVEGLGARPALGQKVAQLCGFAHPVLQQELWGLRFANPLGLAAGFDKNGTAIAGWPYLGFGFAELGSLTFWPQPGNPSPRLFRLPADRAILNRMGFNNAGAQACRDFLQELRERGYRSPIPIGINLGKSKAATDPIADYVASFRLLRDYGDYFVVNVSSPNTPGLRDLQQQESLRAIVLALQAENHPHKPLLVKIAPDLADEDVVGIGQLALELKLAGLIATNTTIARPPLRTVHRAAEAGGLSGPPLRKRSTQVLRLLYQTTGGQLPLVGVGGIEDGATAWEKITAGASLLQLYTGLVYHGPRQLRAIAQDLVQRLTDHGFTHLHQAIGRAVDR
ncbi:MAG: quinone-dependent dihydroorotate dehydrogenase [Pseudanabaenaceae cyanobacterium]